MPSASTQTPQNPTGLALHNGSQLETGLCKVGPLRRGCGPQGWRGHRSLLPEGAHRGPIETRCAKPVGFDRFLPRWGLGSRVLVESTRTARGIDMATTLTRYQHLKPRPGSNY